MNRAAGFLLITCLSVCFSAKASIEPKTIQQVLDQKIQDIFPNAHVGLVIQRLESDHLIYAKHPNQYFFPASTLKLFTSYAALEYLGPEYTYQTTIKFDPKKISSAGHLKGDVIITFSGDPSFTDEKLEQLLLSLKDNGINKILGKIFIENHDYTAPYLSPGATWDTWSYYPPVSSVIINGNIVSVKLEPSATLNEPTLANFVQSPSSLIEQPSTLTHQITTVSEEASEQNCSLETTVNTHNAIHLSGCWPINQRDTILSVSLASPEHAAAQKTLALLKKYAVHYPHQTFYFTESMPIGLRPASQNLKTMANVSSLPLAFLIKNVLKDSDNLYADSLHKRLGRDYFGVGSYAHGVKAQHEILAKSGISMEFKQQFDGSGVSRYNLLTPNQLVTLLTHAYQNKKKYPILLEALPVSGVSGTLKNRFQENHTRICQNKIHAKSGSLRYISALAGYLKVSPKEQYAFALMIQGEPNKLKKIKQKEDTLMAELYQLLVAGS